MGAGEQKQNSAPALEEEMENPQQRNYINKLKEKPGSTLLHNRNRYWKKTKTEIEGECKWYQERTVSWGWFKKRWDLSAEYEKKGIT